MAEIGIETDTNNLKIGNGVDVWTALPYFIGSLSSDIVDALIGASAPDALNVFATMADLPTTVAWGSITGTLSVQTDLQTALNLKANLASPTFTGTVTIPTPFTLGATSITATGTELNYSIGVTSAIQTQLNSKQTTIITGTTAQYFRGDLSLATFPTNVSSFTNDSGYLTANQSISFTPNAGGDVTGSSSGAISLTPNLVIGAGKVTNTMLAGSIAASKLVGTDIATVGTITSGIWSATAIGPTKGGTGLTTYTTGDILYASASNVLSKLSIANDGDTLTLVSGIPAWVTPSPSGVATVSGTTNRITSTGGANPVIDISATFEALLGKVANPLSQFANTTSAQLAGIITNETGTGVLVFNDTPTLIAPVLGTPTSATLTNATGLPISTGISGLGTGVATALAINTGSAGAFVLFNGALGTPSSGVVTNLTGTASGLTAGAVTNATFTTAFTVNTGTLTLTANAANTSVLTIGAGASSVSGTNTGDQTTISGNAATATALATGRTISGTGDATFTTTAFDGTAAVSGAVTVVKINGTSLAGLATGILKNTTATGVPSIAVAGDFPTLNQNTTGSAATLTTSRNIQGVAFNGSANIDIINGTGFVKATGTTISYDNSTYLTTSSASSTYQPLDGDLTTIAGLSPTNDDVMQFKAGAWANRTISQLKTDLSLSGTNTGDQTTITGNAGTATALATGRTISISGDLTYTSPSFDGTGNVTAAGTLATVNSNVGSFGSATQVATFTANAKGLTTAASNVTITPAVGSITGLGTSVATALAINVGSAGAFVTFNGALGTPSSGTLTNTTGLPIVAGTTGTLSIARGGTNLTALGTALQQLRVNAGATDIEYFTPTRSMTFTRVSMISKNNYWSGSY